MLHGLPENSFESFAQKIKELKNCGVTASITIDPEAFQKYGIAAVPSQVLRRGGGYDKIAGNIRMRDIDWLFTEKEKAYLLSVISVK